MLNDLTNKCEFLCKLQKQWSTSSYLKGMQTMTVSLKISIISFSRFFFSFERKILCLDYLLHWSNEYFVNEDKAKLCALTKIFKAIFIYLFCYYNVEQMAYLKSFSPVALCIKKVVLFQTIVYSHCIIVHSHRDPTPHTRSRNYTYIIKH